MTSFIVASILSICQTYYLSEQGGPKCYKTHEEYINPSEVIGMQNTNYISCKGWGYGDVNDNNAYNRCSDQLKKGCKFTLKDGTRLYLSQHCETKFRKVRL